jgi:hypothetical protein
MRSWFTRFRGRLYVWQRSLFRYRVTVMGVLLTGLGAATAFGNPPVAISVSAAAAGLVVSGLEIGANRRRSRALRFQRRDADDYRDVLDDLEAAGRVVRTPRDVGVLMAGETARLRREPVPARLADTPFTVHPDMEKYSIAFLAQRLRRTVMFNGATLGLAADVPLAGDTPVALRPVRYFDFVATNLLAPYDVNEVGWHVPVLCGRDLAFDSRGDLRRLGHSRLANTIGVSTLAFTSDGKLLLVYQTVDVAGSPGLIAPSGSGALEPRDLPGGGRASLQDIVVAGANRELMEECNIDSADIEGGAEVIGFGRWVSRGAMPEFCAVSLLRRTADELLAKRIRAGERVYVDEVRAVRLPAIRDWSAVTGLDLLREKAHRHAVSWPLAFALNCLVEAMRDDTWPLGKRLRERLG